MPEETLHEFTPAERAHWERAVAEAKADAPALILQQRLTRQACRARTVSGQLRRSIQASRIEYEALAGRAGLDVAELVDFMCGRGPLDSDAVDRLAALLDLHLASLP